MMLFGGDVSPSGFSESCLSGEPELLLEPKLAQFLVRAEHVVVNLETVITEADYPIIKCGDNAIKLIKIEPKLTMTKGIYL